MGTKLVAFTDQIVGGGNYRAISVGGAVASNFGVAPAVSDDGSTLCIGAPLDGYLADGTAVEADNGSAWVYFTSGPPGAWVTTPFLRITPPRPATGTRWFGAAVAVASDGEYILIGAPADKYDAAEANPLNNAGSAYLYEWVGGPTGYVLKAKLTAPSRSANAGFGQSVAFAAYVDPNTDYPEVWFAVGAAEAVHLFHIDNADVVTFSTTLTEPVPHAGDQFGSSLAFGGTSAVLAVGANGNKYDAAEGSPLNGAGAVWIFTRSGMSWSSAQKLVGTGITSARAVGSAFGWSIGMSPDGMHLAVGANGHSTDINGANPLSAAGLVFLFVYIGGVWTFAQAIQPTGTNARNAGDNFGDSVRAATGIVVVGADGHQYDASGANPLAGAGAAWRLAYIGGVWTQTDKLAAFGTNGRNAHDEFASGEQSWNAGCGVAASSVGDVVCGAADQAYDISGGNPVVGAGAAYTFFIAPPTNLVGSRGRMWFGSRGRQGG